MGRLRKPDPEKYCEICEARLARKRFPNGDLESLLHFRRRKFCSQACFGASITKERSEGSWSSAHTMARSRVPKGACEKCGKSDALDVHHINGDHQDNRRENLMRICRGCHNKEHRQRASCTICGDPAKGFGYCVKHYQRFKAHGDPMVVKTPPRKTCTICGVPAHSKSLCGKHYMQAKRARTLPA